MKRIAILLLMVLTTTPAMAATCGGLNPVLVLASGIAFGNYHANTASPNTANGTITVSCTVTLGNTLPGFSIGISQGLGSSYSPRRMYFLTSALNYNIYTTNSYSTIWGDGTGNTGTVGYNANSGLGTTNFTAFGAIPQQQFVAAGIYLDTLTVTVTY